MYETEYLPIAIRKQYKTSQILCTVCPRSEFNVAKTFLTMILRQKFIIYVTFCLVVLFSKGLPVPITPQVLIVTFLKMICSSKRKQRNRPCKAMLSC